MAPWETYYNQSGIYTQLCIRINIEFESLLCELKTFIQTSHTSAMCASRRLSAKMISLVWGGNVLELCSGNNSKLCYKAYSQMECVSNHFVKENDTQQIKKLL